MICTQASAARASRRPRNLPSTLRLAATGSRTREAIATRAKTTTDGSSSRTAILIKRYGMPQNTDIAANSSQPLRVMLAPSKFLRVSSLLVLRQGRQVSRLVRLSQLSQQAGEVERFAAERDRPVLARPLAGVAIPGELDAVEIRVVQVDGLVG